jgi:hypothetical protein
MNLLKKMTLGVLAAVALPGMASAQTIIHLSGSTAFRAPTTVAIVQALGGVNNGVYALFSGNTVLTKGVNQIIANNISGGALTSSSIVVETNWTGSLAGVVDTAIQNPLAYPDETNASNLALLTSSGALVTGFTSTTSGTVGAIVTHNVVSDACMSDAFVSSCSSVLANCRVTSTITGTINSAAKLVAAINGAGLVEAGSASVFSPGSASGFLGIVPFQWTLGSVVNGGLTPPTNITQQTAAYLIKNGSAPVSMFSSNGTDAASTDTTDFVYLVGRNEDSGTRIDGFAEPQLAFSQSPKQFFPTFSGGSNTSTLPAPTDYTQIGGTAAAITAFAPWTTGSTLNTEPKITWNTSGHGGFAGGGDVSSVLTTPVNQSAVALSKISQNTGNAYFISYLGVSDSGSFGVANSTKHALTYNGVTCSTAGVLNGSYSFWCYEHMYYPGGSVTAPVKSFCDALADSIATTYANYNSSGASDPFGSGAGVLLPASGTAGSVSRTIEGGIYSLNY